MNLLFGFLNGLCFLWLLGSLVFGNIILGWNGLIFWSILLVLNWALAIYNFGVWYIVHRKKRNGSP